MGRSGEKDGDRIFPGYPPAGLIPRGHKGKVLILWFSFLGIFLGIACAGSEFAVVLPVSLGIFIIDLTLIVYTRVGKRELKLYKEARDNYHSSRYGRALEKLNQIIRLRPDMEKELSREILKCKTMTGDITREEEH